MGATVCVTKYALPVDVFASNIMLPVLFVLIFFSCSCMFEYSLALKKQ